VSLFVSRLSLTKPTFVVVAGDLVATVLLFTSGDGLAEVFAYFLGIGAVVLLFIALLVHAGEEIMEAKKKRGSSSRTSLRPPERDSD
jgi:di/tricarboxylate transporter